MGLPSIPTDFKIKAIFRLIIFAFILFTFTLLVKIYNFDTNKPFNQNKIFNVKLNPAPFCRTTLRLKFNEHLEGNGKYDYLRFDTPIYGIESDDVLLIDEIKNKASGDPVLNKGKKKYFIAMNLFNNEEIIANYIQELVLLIKFLGAENVFLSIYENGSVDKTPEILREFKSFLRPLDVRFNIKTEKNSRPSVYHRIAYLAQIRNKALEPLKDEESKGYKYDKIIFMNDITFCRNDILELLYQSDLQKADFTVPIDIRSEGEPRFLAYRDSWVGRDLNGDVIIGGLVDLIKHQVSAERYNQFLPFQVQCGWNGVAVLNAKPFYGKNALRFRRSKVGTDECAASECSILCNDFWERGFRRIITVPKILVGYRIENISLIDSNIQKILDTNVTLPEKIPYGNGPNQIWCLGLAGNNNHHPDVPGVWKNYIEGDKTVS
ncbi:Alpha-1,3-mannosyltransferase CMT1 [Smittium culicis]|uniref:Alpha-1,3-mannosyltransferase CMT1 n=1 Tax=Smittium culicis TaxID=133412 RepID=A0A1R1XYU2_9FUNG|nr:Alpha-1,3-mannosyltransferase CMT1 [Smittium culicis]